MHNCGDLYRLTHATGNTHAIFDPSCGSTYDSSYSLDMSYDVIHNILEKKQTANFTQVDNSNHLTTMGPDSRLTYDWKYRYDGPQPHAPTQIGQREYYYDDNGNQTGYEVLPTDGDPNDRSFGVNRNIVWDEENRIYAIGDDDPGVRATNYGDVHFVYDDQGTRVYKIKGGDITAYINQFYVVEKPQGVDGSVGSKHIFIGNSRIASQIVNPKDDQTLFIDASVNPCPNCVPNGCTTCGLNLVNSYNGGWGSKRGPTSQRAGSSGQSDLSDDQVQFVTALSDGVTIYDTDSVMGHVVGTVDSCETLTLRTLNPYTGFYEVQYNGQPAYVQQGAVTVGMPVSCQGVWPSSSVMPEDYFVFFYHTDHLGSTGYMSDGKGALTEHIEYIPFGESWIEQRRGLKLFPSYQFTSKEWDPETGLYYYGARYYDPRTSVWLSTDQIIAKALSDQEAQSRIQRPMFLAEYSYVYLNPLVNTDLDGKDAIPIAFPEYKVSLPLLGRTSGLGHGGIILIDNRTGVTRYYEYGRYDKAEKGIVRKMPIPNVVMDHKTGMPTEASMKALLKKVSAQSGQNSPVEGTYVKSDKFKEMVDYAEGRVKQNKDPKRESYSLISRNCGTFTQDVLEGGGEKPSSRWSSRPNSIISDLQDQYKNTVSFDPKKNKLELKKK